MLSSRRIFVLMVFLCACSLIALSHGSGADLADRCRQGRGGKRLGGQALCRCDCRRSALYERRS